MKSQVFKFFLFALMTFPLAAQAQGVIGGAEQGSANGAAVAGPVGAVVGGAVGAVTGGVSGLLGVDQLPRFREFLLSQPHPQFVYDKPIRSGVVLPLENITYYPVPPEFGVSPDYRYAIINQEAVIVDPRTRRIIQVID
jgi:hypothetical protein